MRQFILANGVVTTGAVAENTNYGKVGIAAMMDNALAFLNKTTAETLIEHANVGELYLALLRDNANMGNVILPIHTNHLSVNVAQPSAATIFEATVTLPEEVNAFLDYTIIVVKKGMKFNERNKWTATVHTKTSDTVETLGDKLVELINANIGSGVTASVSEGVITITAKEAGVDYNIVCADELIDANVAITTKGAEAIGDWKYIKDLADKAAADAGFEYTYDEGIKLYPGYPLALESEGSNTKYIIVTIRFAEPRDVKTRDEVVHQIVQIAIPVTETEGAASLTEILTLFADKNHGMTNSRF